MVKFFYGVLITFVICGTAYFFIGQTDYTEVRDIADSIQRSNKEAQHSISGITGRLDGLSDTASSIAGRSITITEGSNKADSRVTTIKSGLSEVNNTVTRIERRNIEVVRIVRDLGDTNYEFRKLIKENKVQE